MNHLVDTNILIDTTADPIVMDAVALYASPQWTGRSDPQTAELAPPSRRGNVGRLPHDAGVAPPHKAIPGRTRKHGCAVSFFRRTDQGSGTSLNSNCSGRVITLLGVS